MGLVISLLIARNVDTHGIRNIDHASLGHCMSSAKDSGSVTGEIRLKRSARLSPKKSARIPKKNIDLTQEDAHGDRPQSDQCGQTLLLANHAHGGMHNMQVWSADRLALRPP